METKIKEQKVIITKGLSGSGKTTWAKKQSEDNPGKYKIVCKDDLRRMLDNDKHSSKREEFILIARDTLIQASLTQGYDVIIADTNLNPIHEEAIVKLIDSFNKSFERNVKVEIKSFLDIPIDTCIEQDLKRQYPVGEKVIRQQYRQWVAPKIIKSPKTVSKNQQNTSLPKAIMVDLDGTVALMGDRSPYDYDKVDLDLPNSPVIDIVTKYSLTHQIIFMSGREDSCEAKTREWINYHIVDNDLYHLFMRKSGDKRKDSIVKRELFEQNIQNKYFIQFVLDDRDQVVEMWRNELGLTCLQVDYGNF